VLEEALAEVRTGRDAAAESQVLWNLMVLETWGGEDYAAAIDFGRQAVDLARPHRLAAGRAPMVRADSHPPCSKPSWRWPAASRKARCGG
jgi:hypothetical protein